MAVRTMDDLLRDLRERVGRLERRPVGGGGGNSYLLGAIYPWTAPTDPSWGLELKGQTIVGGAITYSGIAALNPSWVSGSNLVLPDWRGRVPVGKTASGLFSTLGGQVGSETHTLTVAEMPSHTHTQNAHAHGAYHRNTAYKSGTGNMPGADAISALDAYTYAFNADTSSTIATNQNTGGGGAHNNVQPSVVVRWFVCAATSAGDFDTEVQTALVASVNELIAVTDRSPRGVIPSSVVVGSGSASVADDGTVTFTGCSWVALNDVFDGVGLDAYEIIAEGASASAATITHRLRAAGTDLAGTTYNYASQYIRLSDGPTRASGIGVGQFGVLVPTGAASDFSGKMQVYRPARALQTLFTMHSISIAGGDRWDWTEGGNGGTTVCDGITLRASTGTVSGTIKVVKVA